MKNSIWILPFIQVELSKLYLVFLVFTNLPKVQLIISYPEDYSFCQVLGFFRAYNAIEEIMFMLFLQFVVCFHQHAKVLCFIIFFLVFLVPEYLFNYWFVAEVLDDLSTNLIKMEVSLRLLLQSHILKSIGLFMVLIVFLNSCISHWRLHLGASSLVQN